MMNEKKIGMLCAHVASMIDSIAYLILCGNRGIITMYERASFRKDYSGWIIFFLAFAFGTVMSRPR